MRMPFDFPFTSLENVRYNAYAIKKYLTKQLEETANIAEVRFVDPMYVICESRLTCKHSFDGKGIISADSGHFTPYGAGYFGNKLEEFFLKNEAY